MDLCKIDEKILDVCKIYEQIEIIIIIAVVYIIKFYKIL